VLYSAYRMNLPGPIAINTARSAKTSRKSYQIQRRRIIAIPAQNEADRLQQCLQALAIQEHSNTAEVVLLLNNCTDHSAALVRHLAPQLPYRLHLFETQLPPALANAGCARRLAMNHAVRLAGPDGILLTTDADGCVAPNWLSANLKAIAAGADAVAGRAVIDPHEAALIPAHLHEADARECAYAALLDTIAGLLDPDPADPLPRHDEHSGASIAVTGAAYVRAGGIPAVPLGEDREFFTALQRIDARIRHDPSVSVIVSGRTEGRASGGMAATIRRRMIAPDPTLDGRLESADRFARRLTLRHAARTLWSALAVGQDEVSLIAELANGLRLAPATVTSQLCAEHFGGAWAMLEALSPALVRRPVPVSDLANETARAEMLLAELLAQSSDHSARSSRSIRYSASRLCSLSAIDSAQAAR
jgi:Glycosyl transferase family 2